MKDHALPHQGLKFGHRMQAVEDIIVGVTQIIGIVGGQQTSAVFGVLKRLGDGKTNGPKLSSGAKLVAKDTEENTESAVFHVLVPGGRQFRITRLDGGGDGGVVARLIHRKEHITAVTGQISPAGRALFIHGQGVAIHPKAIERQVAAKVIAALVFAGLQAPGNLHVGEGLLAKVAPDDGGKLFEGLKNRKVQLGEKVARKDNVPVRIDNELTTSSFY